MRLINYARHDERERTTPLNLVVLRVTLSAFLVWKIVSLLHLPNVLAWPRYAEPPVFGRFTNELIVVAAGVAIALLIATGLGVATRYTAPHAGIAVVGFAKLLDNVVGASVPATFLVPAFTLVFIGWYSSNTTLGPLAVDVDGSSLFEYRPLFLMQVVLALHYALAAYEKVSYGELAEWTTGASLRRWLHHQQVFTGRDLPVADLLVDHPILSSIAANATLPLEFAFFVALVLRLKITYVALALLGMHAVIAASMTPFFFDRAFFFLLFLPYDELYARFTAGGRIEVVAQSWSRFLALLTLLDVNDRLDVDVRPDAAFRLPTHPDVDDPRAFLCGEFHLPGVLGDLLDRTQ